MSENYAEERWKGFSGSQVLKSRGWKWHNKIRVRQIRRHGHYLSRHTLKEVITGGKVVVESIVLIWGKIT
jgi:hypothetical protein